MRPSVEAAWESSTALISTEATRLYDGLADPANWPAVLFFVAALIVLRLSLRLASGAPSPGRLVTVVIIPALACTIAPYPNPNPNPKILP